VPEGTLDNVNIGWKPTAPTAGLTVWVSKTCGELISGRALQRAVNVIG
jgi:hypothetical protein